MPKEEDFGMVQRTVDGMLGVKTSELRKKASAEDIHRAKIINIIRAYEDLIARDKFMLVNANINFQDYNLPFYDMIDEMMEIIFPDEHVRQVVFFYLFERLTPDNKIIPLSIAGRTEYLEDAEQLYGLIKFITHFKATQPK